MVWKGSSRAALETPAESKFPGSAAFRSKASSCLPLKKGEKSGSLGLMAVGGSKKMALAAAVLLAATTRTQAGDWFDWSLKGYGDARLIVTDDTRGWQDEGLGKTRYGGTSGGDRQVLPRFAEAGLVLDTRFGWAARGHLYLKYDDRQKHPIDIGEGYLTLRSSPVRSFRYGAKLGTFFPPVSLENTGIGWTSPYTISSSAINSWVGEELRINGAEFHVERAGEETDLRLRGGLFAANDPAGSVLAWRGWAIGDRKAGLFDRLSLPDLGIFGPGRLFQRQAQTFEPLHELDGKVGFYVQPEWQNGRYGQIRAMYYHNNGSPMAIDLEHGQYAWRTRFFALGGRTVLPWNVELISQFMTGDTGMGPKRGPRGRTMLDMDYWAYFALVSRTFGNHRLSFRYDHFVTRDLDAIRKRDNNGESGDGYTLAYSYTLANRHRFMVEMLYIDSDREARGYLGNPARAEELAVQFNYRLFL
jgi:hypothetical protein